MEKYVVEVGYKIIDCSNCIYTDRYNTKQNVRLEGSLMSGVVEVVYSQATCRLSGKKLPFPIPVNSKECGMSGDLDD